MMSNLWKFLFYFCMFTWMNFSTLNASHVPKPVQKSQPHTFQLKRAFSNFRAFKKILKKKFESNNSIFGKLSLIFSGISVILFILLIILDSAFFLVSPIIFWFLIISFALTSLSAFVFGFISFFQKGNKWMGILGFILSFFEILIAVLLIALAIAFAL